MPAAQADSRVFLPRLPEGTTDEVLRVHFARFGDISDVYIPVHPATGKPKGMAFVTFASSEHAAAALAQAEQQINGEACEVVKAAPRPDKRGGGGPIRRDPEVADPYIAGFLHAQRMMMGGAGRPPIIMAKERSPPRLDTRPRIFVRDVPDTFEDAVLQRHFEQFGEVTDLYQPEHKSPGVQGKKKGIAYVTYRAEQHLSACLAEGEKQLVDGVEITVTRADPRREKERAAGFSGGYDLPLRSRSPPRGHDYGRGAYGGGAGGGGRSSSAAQNNRIFVGGISPDLASDDVAEHFRKHGGEITDIYFPRDARSGSKRGFCYITFQENLAVHRAVANAPREIKGLAIGEVKVAEARPGDGGPAGGRGLPRGGADRGPRGGDLGSYGYGRESEARGRGSYERSSYDDGNMGWGGGMMPGAAIMPMPYDYAPRSAEHWSGGGGAYGMPAFAEGMPREGAEIMQRMAPLLNLLATAGGGGGYGGSSAPAPAAYGPAGAGGWGQGSGQGGVGGLQGQAGYGAHSMPRDNADGRYRPY